MNPISKRRKLEKFVSLPPTAFLIPRQLNDDFDLNIAIPYPSIISNRDDCSSTSNEVNFIAKVRGELGFQVDFENIHSMENIIGNEI